MATVFKRGADKGKRRAPWYIGYRDYTGKWRYRRAFTDKAASERLAAKMEEQHRMVREGLLPLTALDEIQGQDLEEILKAYRQDLKNRDVSPQYLLEAVNRIRRIAKKIEAKRLVELTVERIEQVLADMRAAGKSRETHNHYVKGFRQFGNWLVRTRRRASNPFANLQTMNVEVDRRHRRRALSYEELAALVAAAREAGSIENISGPDRAMMYVLAAWTGYRKGEIGSLTLRSFDLEGEPATVTVEAGHSKRRRRDTQVLHPEVVEMLRQWLAERGGAEPDELLFPVSGKVPGGLERKTHKMMERDLAAARKAWLDEASDEAERERRERSDFLLYKNSRGEFADFHATRHTFITNLARAGVAPKTAQTLARHSDIRLTMDVYTHIDLAEKTAAVRQLPGPAQWIGSIRATQRGNLGHFESPAVAEGEAEGREEDSAEDADLTGLSNACHEESLTDSSIPGRIRTCNLRLRRPTLYPIELRGLSCCIGRLIMARQSRQRQEASGSLTQGRKKQTVFSGISTLQKVLTFPG